jgi:hypothetical protein
VRRSTALLLLLAVAGAALAAAASTLAAAPAKPGAKCTRAGARAGTLTCTRAGNTLVWKRAPAPRAPAPRATTTPRPATTTTTTTTATTACSPTEPLKLKGIGVALGPYDAAAATAGVFQFTKGRLQEKRVFMDFGYVIPNAQNGPKTNPQPTFIVPKGTPVLAMIDGYVNVIDLWSTPALGDVSVMIGCTGTHKDRYQVEAEHVISPLVKNGDFVHAGQQIAEAGPLSNEWNSGLYVVEIGILTSGSDGRPHHICPFANLDASVRDTILGQLRGLMAAWEAYTGDTSLYDEAAWVGGVPGCLATDIGE